VEEGKERKRSITLHRPHGSRIEGTKLLLVTSRLKRVLNWRAESFEVEEQGK
jgi:hypothetical protein